MTSQHLEQAQHNEAFLVHLNSSCPEEFYDWKLTVLYYAALHYMRAYLVKKNHLKIDTHDDVLKAINPVDKSLGPGRPVVKNHIFYGFKELHKSSNKTRYEFHCFINSKAAQQELYNNYRETLSEIKNYLKHTHSIDIN